MPPARAGPFTAAIVGCLALRSRDIAIDIRFGPVELAAGLPPAAVRSLRSAPAQNAGAV
ncbi:unannotated protein [freshwater metagenome]|uniref:Unannotated protein n=1 Tax=freshwater metagenome TaxID=449393 RepID=A0A6J6SA38_9ZZZZ